MESKWSPKGAKWSPNGAPKRLRELGRKKEGHPGNSQATGPIFGLFLESCAVFLGNFFDFFQGRFLIDFLMVFGFILGRFWGLFVVTFLDFVKFYADRVLS